jgi:HEAT repeats
MGVIALLSVVNGQALAKTSDEPSIKSLIDLSGSGKKNNGMQLKVSQMSLAQVLNAIAKEVQIPIHYSKLPGNLVSVVCKESSLKHVLECLLENKADLILRYSHKQDKTGSNRQIAEAWVLGTPSNNAVITPDIPVATDVADTTQRPVQQNQQGKVVSVDRTDELLAKAQSQEPDERVEAVGDLLTGGRKGDPDVKAALERALTDEDAEVRAQAISSLSHREGNNAAAAIQQALQDSSEDVRIMAVESIVDDVALLQQAINDSDDFIRILAETKLELLTRDQNDISK